MPVREAKKHAAREIHGAFLPAGVGTLRHIKERQNSNALNGVVGNRSRQNNKEQYEMRRASRRRTATRRGYATWKMAAGIGIMAGGCYRGRAAWRGR